MTKEITGLHGSTDREMLLFIHACLRDGNSVKWALERLDTHFEIQDRKREGLAA